MIEWLNWAQLYPVPPCRYRCRCRGFLHSTKQSAAGYPTISFSSDPIYLEIASDYAGWGFESSVPQDCSPYLADFKCQLQIQVVTWASDQLTINQRFINQIPCLASVNLLEWLKQLRRTHFLARLLSYYKGYQRNWIYSKMKRYIEWGLKHRSSVLVAHGTWHSGTRKYSVSPLWKLSSKGPKSCYFWLLWRLHYIVMTD